MITITTEEIPLLDSSRDPVSKPSQVTSQANNEAITLVCTSAAAWGLVIGQKYSSAELDPLENAQPFDSTS